MKGLIELRTAWQQAEQEYKIAQGSLDSSPLEVIVCKEALKQSRFNYALACREYVEDNLFGEDGA